VKEDFQHYYTDQKTSPENVKTVILSLKNGRSYSFKSPEGVFAFGKTDRATRLLIEKCHIGPGGRVLDLGSGFGMVGITLKLENPDISLFMSDINTRAVVFSKINARDNNIVADIRKGSLYEPWSEMSFDAVLSNPPMAAGKAVWERIVSQAPEHLAAGGSLQLVAYHNKGGSRIEALMREVFGNTETLVKSGGIRVYVSRKL
jgi:16S rRNA G1207 methylase RsmC